MAVSRLSSCRRQRQSKPVHRSGAPPNCDRCSISRISLLAKTISTTLDRAMLEQIILDGFFPLTSVSDLPQESRGAGLREVGLPYAADPVVSKHLARFLRRSLTNVKASETQGALVKFQALEGEYIKPTAVLFNGGVFNAAPIRHS